MKTARRALCLLALGAVVAVRADPVNDAIVAAMKLSEASNYTWISSTEKNERTAEMRGKTNSSGYSLITFVGYSPPAAAAGGRTMRSAMPGDSIDTVFMGDTSYVVQTGSGWTNPGSAADPAATSGKNSRGTGGTGGGGGSSVGGSGGLSGGGLGGGGSGRRGGRGSRGGSGSGDSGGDAGSGAPAPFPPGINLPHEELAIIVANYTDLHVDGDIASGALNQIGTELLIVPPGSKDAPPEGSAGTFRLWIKDGVVTKYELKLTAKTAPGGRAVKGGFSETIIVELKDVGTTTVDVPAAAKQRLTS